VRGIISKRFHAKARLRTEGRRKERRVIVVEPEGLELKVENTKTIKLQNRIWTLRKNEGIWYLIGGITDGAWIETKFTPK